MIHSDNGANAILYQLSQLHQAPNVMLPYHQEYFNSIARPILSIPQLQPDLQRLYIQSLNSSDLRMALEQGLPYYTSLADLQSESIRLARKFISIDAYKKLYTLRQRSSRGRPSGGDSIRALNAEIDELLGLLEEPMADDLLQDLYRKALRPEVARAIGHLEFESFNHLRHAVLQICSSQGYR
ncbi:hypothetical protein DV495_001798 [Geotrichum candidum]|nr:hypothetical protein DV452_003005 [Geotrichum candidum]KAI9210914.1 hypothetical protein DS838_004217 [Geotrichum bryndzae]KAF5116879.1 hypothetical protein DV454_001407 [Geotrichum candidum]KAF5131984.1 hypothetical protein DV495_001798 [Geotrichum candidum]KAF7497631.1 hypothetical protein DV113_004334 [Geotrichum candidum]